MSHFVTLPSAEENIEQHRVRAEHVEYLDDVDANLCRVGLLSSRVLTVPLAGLTVERLLTVALDG